MKKEWDYILKEDKYSITLLRIYPNQTRVHSFGNKPPKTWKQVYKVYYSWSIIKQYKDSNGSVEPNSSQRLMYMYCDESSNIFNLHLIIRWVIEQQKEYDEPTFGQPAGDWRIEINKGINNWNDKPYEYYNFEVFDNWNGNGFRFTLDRKQTEDFANWLEKMNDRALVKCGCPI